jgi:hypothetical protein
MTIVQLKIQEEADVKRGARLLLGEEVVAGLQEIEFSFAFSSLLKLLGEFDLDRAREEVDIKGDLAIHLYLFDAVRLSKLSVKLSLKSCNLSELAVHLLAEAVRQNTSLTGLVCVDNPFNFDEHGDYDPESDRFVERAIIESPADIQEWNGGPLTEGLRSRRTAFRAAKTQGRKEAAVGVLIPKVST